jgi:hypothetical protein
MLHNLSEEKNEIRSSRAVEVSIVARFEYLAVVATAAELPRFRPNATATWML